ncbi:uncharacterized protein METZ01_LOCUS306537, partial [marine metagenome]
LLEDDDRPQLVSAARLTPRADRPAPQLRDTLRGRTKRLRALGRAPAAGQDRACMADDNERQIKGESIIDQLTQTELEAAAFRRLLKHLDKHKEVQNIDLMNLAGFCRNCLS